MNIQNIPVNKFMVNAVSIWGKRWFLLTAGDFSENKFNTMAVAWGSFGMMWNYPFAQVVVRPTRFTFDFCEKYDTFTLCSFPEKYREAVLQLGRKSGREGDKISEAGLQPIASEKIAAPVFQEADLRIECEKIYFDDLRPQHFLDSKIENNYPLQDYHRFYFGKIVRVSGISEFSAEK